MNELDDFLTEPQSDEFAFEYEDVDKNWNEHDKRQLDDFENQLGEME